MRTSVALAYDLFTKNPGVEFSREAIEAYTEIVGGGGAAAIVRRMQNDCSLPIIKIVRDKTIAYYMDASHVVVEPKLITHHYEKLAKRVARVSAPQIATASPIDAIDAAIASSVLATETDFVAPEVATTEEPVAEVAPPAKRVRKSRAKKNATDHVRELEMHE